MVKIYKIGAAIIKDRKLLIVKERGWEMYGVPGGKLEEGEDDYTCLKREIKEELGVSINGIFNFLGTFEDYAMNEPDTTLQMKFYNVKLAGEPKKTGDVEDMRWFGRNDDREILGSIDKNHLIPALIESDLI